MLDELDRDESTEFSMETSQDPDFKMSMHDRQKQVKKAKKQARIQQLHSQLAETDHQLDMLKQKTLAKSTTGKGSSQPAATSMPQNTVIRTVMAPASRFGCSQCLSEPIG